MSPVTIETEDIVTNILSRLPVKSIGRFRCVSKTWCKLLSNPHFIETQLNHAIDQNNYPSLLVLAPKKYHHSEYIKIHSVDYDSDSSTFSKPVDIGFKSKRKSVEIWGSRPKDNTSVDMWGTCNGLVCFTSSGLKGYVCLWNPSTNEFKKIPKPPTGDEDEFIRLTYGFGYDCNTEDYMLVRIAGGLDVFTLRSNSWKAILDIPYGMSFGLILIFNGALHWIANPNWEYKEAIVLATYEISSGRFKDMPLPKEFENKFEIVYVGVLGGCLCLTANLYKVHTEVWVMKEYGVQESWNRLFTIDQHTPAGSFKILKLLQRLKNGDIMFQKDHSALFIYDPEQGAARTSEIQGITRDIRTWAYSSSLVSPNSNTSTAQEQRRQA